MAPKTLTFHLTLEQLEARRQQLAAQGIELPLPSGTIERGTVVGKVNLAYHYAAATGTLAVTILHAPLFAEGKVESTINAWFQES